MNSFRFQLIYGIGILAFLLFVSFAFVNYKNQEIFLHEEALKQASNRSLALATNSRVWVLANDYIGLEEVLNSFSIYDDLVFASIINMDGKIIAHTKREYIGKYIADEKRVKYLKKVRIPVATHNDESQILLHDMQNIDIVQIIHNGNQHIGIVNIRIDQSIREETINATMIRGILFTLSSLLLAMIFAYFTANGLTQRLLSLLKTMKKVRHGDKSVQADEEGVSEMSVLAHEFNVMLETLNKTEAMNTKLSERLELAFVGSHDGLWDWNLIENTIYFSPLWKEMLGYSDKELSNELETWSNRVHTDDAKKAWADIQKHIEGKNDFYENIHRLEHKDGHWVWILARGKALYDDNGKAIRMVGTHTDVSADKEKELKYLHQAQIVAQVQDSVITTDLDGNITSWNLGSTQMLEYTEDEVLGKPMSMIHRHEDIEINIDTMGRLLAEGSLNIDSYLVKKSKEVVPVSVSLSVLFDEEGNSRGFIGVSQDISLRKESEKALLEQKNILDYQAHHDVLTSLPNRLLFSDRLEQAVIKNSRHNENFALFFIDLDQFKQINDSLGHDYGDEVLQIVATRLQGLIRKEDTLARLGGDEFTILMHGISKAEDASSLAIKILKSLSQSMKIGENTLYISCSIGISLCPEDGTDVQNLLKFSDAAMYRAKDEGRNNFQFYSVEMTQRAFDHVAMEASLRNALVNDEFIVYYQTQIDALSDKIIGMEALVRWEHPTLGVVSPAHFIPIAEESGLIIQLDQWVMQTAMKQLRSWYNMDLNPGRLALNLAIKQLQQDDFLDILHDKLRESGCHAEWIELEVTEGKIMSHPEDAISMLEQLSALGIKLAIDDFGTGYSSLSYLKRLPIDKLKIDQSFIRDLPGDADDVGIVQAIIALSKSLHLDVIAEGVEQIDQKDFLVANGCSNIQGYLYHKPIPANEMEALLRSKKELS